MSLASTRKADEDSERERVGEVDLGVFLVAYFAIKNITIKEEVGGWSWGVACEGGVGGSGKAGGQGEGGEAGAGTWGAGSEEEEGGPKIRRKGAGQEQKEEEQKK